jgi:Histidine kinase-like ATPase domain
VSEAAAQLQDEHKPVRLVVPARAEHLRAVRLMAADAASRAGFDCDATDDLRIAVDEICHAVMALTDQPLQLDFDVEAGAVAICGAASVPGSARLELLSAVSEMIVHAVSDICEIEQRDGRVRFLLAKHRKETTWR